jgi:alpha-glucuronidase
VTVVTGNTDTVALYSAFALLRHLQTVSESRIADILDVPKVKLRLLNHWDNLDRHVERGYAGESIWDWWRLPDHIDSRYEDYARANASLGINGTVLNNVNAQAEVLLPRGGVVIWRVFVYSEDDPEDRVRQAYSEFKPLDGRFADNVLVQVKNGPLDFQPREPFHPLFGAMPDTPLLMEFQVTQEYLGFSTYLVYRGALWAEVLAADTEAAGEGSTVARIRRHHCGNDDAIARRWLTT